MTTPTDPNPPRPEAGRTDRPISARRRLLIKRAAVMTPGAIFTLYSGAALARSSIQATQATSEHDPLLTRGDLGLNPPKEPACIDGDPITGTTKLAPPYRVYPQGTFKKNQGCQQGVLITASSGSSLTGHHNAFFERV